MQRAGWRVPVVLRHSDPDPTAPPEDSGLVRERIEAKHLLAEARADALCTTLASRLTHHHYSGQHSGLNLLSVARIDPQIQHFTSTLYLDTDQHALWRAAESSRAHFKVRVREYCDVPRRAEPVQRVLWLEIKEREGDRSRKRRAAMTRADAAAVLAALALEDGRASQRAVQELRAQRSEPALALVLDELVDLRLALGAALRPSCVVHYRRQSFQGGSGTLRVTVDRRVQAFRAERNVLDHDRLTPDVLGPAVYDARACVVEAKSLGPLPSWLVTLLAEHGAQPVEYSKLVMASRAVHSQSR